MRGAYNNYKVSYMLRLEYFTNLERVDCLPGTTKTCARQPKIRPKKIKDLFAFLAWKLGGLVDRFFFSFFLIVIYLFCIVKVWMQKKYNIIHVCEFLGM